MRKALGMMRGGAPSWAICVALAVSILLVGCGGADDASMGTGGQEEAQAATGGADGVSARDDVGADGEAVVEAASGDAEPEEGERMLTRRERMLAEAQRRASQQSQREVGENEGPQASFTVRPLEGWADLTYYRFDASLSSDDWDLSGQLEKRWDFDGDGAWDSEITGRGRVSHMFSEPGTYRPRLWVRDTGGLVDSLTGDPIVVNPACPPPDFAMVDHNPNSPAKGRTFRLSEQRGHPVLVWFTAPSK